MNPEKAQYSKTAFEQNQNDLEAAKASISGDMSVEELKGAIDKRSGLQTQQAELMDSAQEQAGDENAERDAAAILAGQVTEQAARVEKLKIQAEVDHARIEDVRKKLQEAPVGDAPNASSREAYTAGEDDLKKVKASIRGDASVDELTAAMGQRGSLEAQQKQMVNAAHEQALEEHKELVGAEKVAEESAKLKAIEEATLAAMTERGAAVEQVPITDESSAEREKDPVMEGEVYGDFNEAVALMENKGGLEKFWNKGLSYEELQKGGFFDLLGKREAIEKILLQRDHQGILTEGDKKLFIAHLRSEDPRVIDSTLATFLDGKQLLNDREIMLEAAKRNPRSALMNASEQLKNDREFVLQAVDNAVDIDDAGPGYLGPDWRDAVDYLPPNLKNDPEIVQTAKDAALRVTKSRILRLNAAGKTITYIPPELKQDAAFMAQVESSRKQAA